MEATIKTIDNLLDVKEIYLEPKVYELSRGQEILARFPEAQRIEVPSHWKIPELHGNEGSVKNWNRIKSNVLVLGVKKSLTCRENCRSSHFVAPSLANGCTMSCVYCYVPRRKGFANPITVFVNIEQITRYLRRHAGKLGDKTAEDTIDPEYWVYDIGENSDCSVDADISDNIKDIVRLFTELPNAKATFATKFVNRNLLDYDPQGKTRIRFSLMPAGISRVVDVRTSPIGQRISAIDDFVEAGYEVHLNFSPIIFYQNWLQDYSRLLEEINDTISEKSKKQLRSEVIFLTHNEPLHEVNMGWHPRAEELLWKPEIQEVKYSQTGGRNVRYKRNLKRELVDQFLDLLQEKMSYCQVRYAF